MPEAKKAQPQKASQAVHHHRSKLDKLADAVSAFTGSWVFIILHLIWFAVWFMCSLGVDDLTLILSVEAIFLATFILMTQNRQAVKDTRREMRDLASDLRAEREILEIRKIVNKIHQELHSRK